MIQLLRRKRVPQYTLLAASCRVGNYTLAERTRLDEFPECFWVLASAACNEATIAFNAATLAPSSAQRGQPVFLLLSAIVAANTTHNDQNHQDQFNSVNGYQEAMWSRHSGNSANQVPN